MVLIMINQYWFNSSPSSAAYMRQWIGSALVQIMAIRRQAIIWTNVGILLIGPLGTNFTEISIEILTFSFKKMRLKVSPAKQRPFCPGGDELSNDLVPHGHFVWIKVLSVKMAMRHLPIRVFIEFNTSFTVCDISDICSPKWYYLCLHLVWKYLNMALEVVRVKPFDSNMLKVYSIV